MTNFPYFFFLGLPVATQHHWDSSSGVRCTRTLVEAHEAGSFPTDERGYICSMCNAPYSNLRQLRSHLDRHSRR